MSDTPRYYVKLSLDGFDGKSNDMNELTPTQRYVWFSYIAFARRFLPHGFLSVGVEDGRPVPATVDRLAEWADVGRRTIIRTNQRLVELGMIRKDRRRNVVCLEVVNWSKWQDNDGAKESLEDGDGARVALPTGAKESPAKVPESHRDGARVALVSPEIDGAKESPATAGGPEPQGEAASHIPENTVPECPSLESTRVTSRETSTTTPSPQQPALDIEGLPVAEECGAKVPAVETEVQLFIKATFAALELGEFPTGKKNLKGYSRLTDAIAKKGLPLAEERVNIMLAKKPRLPHEAKAWLWFADTFLSAVMRPWEFGVQKAGSQRDGGHPSGKGVADVGNHESGEVVWDNEGNPIGRRPA